MHLSINYIRFVVFKIKRKEEIFVLARKGRRENHKRALGFMRAKRPKLSNIFF